eukprot:RCo032889
MHFAPRGLGQVQSLQQLLHPELLQGQRDLVRGSAQHTHSVAGERRGQRQRQVASHGAQHTLGVLHLTDVEHNLQRELLDVQPITSVEVRRDGLWAAVHDNGTLALAAEGLQGLHHAPVVRLVGAARPHHNVPGGSEVHVVLLPGKGEVQGVDLCGELPGAGVHLAGQRDDPQAAPQHSHQALRGPGQGANVAVAEPALLGLSQKVLVRGGERDLAAAQCTELAGDLRNVPQAKQEPPVDLADVEDVVHADTGQQGLHYGEDPLTGGHGEPLHDGLDLLAVGALLLLGGGAGLGPHSGRTARRGRGATQAGHHTMGLGGVISGVGEQCGVAFQPLGAGVSHPQGLVQGLLEAATDAHHLPSAAGGFSAELHSAAVEPGVSPGRHLHHAVVQGRLEARRGGLGHCVDQLGKALVKVQLRGDVGQGVAGSLRGQSRGAREAGAHVHHAVLLRPRAQREPHAALSDHSEVADDPQRGGLER